MVIKNEALDATLKNDFHRPTYHYLPHANWMNDPNGVIQWDGRYHLFYQYNPDGAYHANMHWGHAVSDDLVHWEELPIALHPTPESPDRGGIFSGCIVNHNQTPTAFYTGVNEDYQVQVQCIATGSPDLVTWEKYENNPVIGIVPPELGQTADFRDPFVWQEDDGWYMVLGSGIKGAGGVVLLYRSDNLTDWEYLHPLYTNNNRAYGTIWECPNFFKLGDKWILIISAHSGITTDTVFYFVGDYIDHHFIPIASGVLDYGNLYATLTCLDDHNRRLMFGWIREARSEVDQRLARWSGVQSIPRILTLSEEHELMFQPVPEMETARGQHWQSKNIALNGTIPLEASGLALDIEAEFVVGDDGVCGLTLAMSNDSADKTEIVYYAGEQQLKIRKMFPETNMAINTHSRIVPHTLSAGESLQLRILLDGSVLEVIANERTSLTSRIYPTSRDSVHTNVFGTDATLEQLDIWKMESIW